MDWPVKLSYFRQTSALFFRPLTNLFYLLYLAILKFITSLAFESGGSTSLSYNRLFCGGFLYILAAFSFAGGWAGWSGWVEWLGWVARIELIDRWMCMMVG